MLATINNKIELEFFEKTLLSDILVNAGIKDFSMPCGGKGSCGKCKARAVGNLSEMSAEELFKLTDSEKNQNIRLACRAYAVGDVNISYNGGDITVETSGYLREHIKNPLTRENSYAAVIDVGTTTIAAYLYKMPECTLVKTAVGLNEQVKFGADVISRIQYTIDNSKDILHDTIINQIKNILADFETPSVMVITANTTMLHFLLNLDAEGISKAPFTPTSLFGGFYEILGIKTYIPKCIASYVGADITCGILASGMTDNTTEKSFLVDLGTNGEIAFFDGANIYAASTAAGPAFEGAGIFQGVPAKGGAINSVFVENGEIGYSTINNEKPIGICGSGLIDCIAVMLDEGILDESGYINEDGHNHAALISEDENTSFKIGDSGIIITSRDIRQVQLAKSAIKAGIMTILEQAGNPEVDTFYIAGGFGSYINVRNAEKIGLLPSGTAQKAKILGNAAAMGASLSLFSKEELEKSEKIAETAKTAELSGNPIFMEHYVENMMF